MIGIKNFDYEIHKEIIEDFFQLAESGKTLPGDSKGHLDGWGIGYYKNGKALIFRSGGSVAEEKEKFFKKIEEVSKSKILIVHFRKSAWKNTSTPRKTATFGRNSHPFRFKNFIFAHNGTIYDYKRLLKISGLDSETFFRFIAKSIRGDITQDIKKAVEYVKNNHKFTSLTFLLSDGKSLYAYRDYKKSPDYYTLYKHNSTISSEPLMTKGPWEVLRKGNLVLVQ